MKCLTSNDMTLLIDALKHKGIFITNYSIHQEAYEKAPIQLSYMAGFFDTERTVSFYLFNSDFENTTKYDKDVKIKADLPVDVKIIIRLAYMIYLIETFCNKELTEKVLEIAKKLDFHSRNVNIETTYYAVT